jgi:hypothetical protein
MPIGALMTEINPTAGAETLTRKLRIRVVDARPE